MNNNEITPEYIASIANTLTQEELTELIRDYGSQEADTASYWASKESGFR